MTKLIPITALFAAACGMPFPPATHIERPRLLGAKVTADVDPTRAWPAPGETATVTWITASPTGSTEFSWLLSACPAATTTGMPMCDGPAFAVGRGSGPAPLLGFTVPLDIASDAIVITGYVCASSSVSVDESGAPRCDDGSRVETVSRHVFVAYAGSNANPSLTDGAFTVAGMPWQAASEEGCRGVLPELAASDELVVLGATLDDTDRETFTTSSGDALREHLELSAFSTAGELMQPKAFVDPDDTRALASLGFEWQPPDAADVPDEGLRARFTFVVRDLRGGTDAAVRELCVVP
jgi:hypothetical protein